MKINLNATLQTTGDVNKGNGSVVIRGNKIIFDTKENKDFARFLMQKIRNEMRSAILKTVYKKRHVIRTDYSKNYTLFNFIPQHPNKIALSREKAVIEPDLMQFYRKMPSTMFIDRQGYNPYVMAKILFHTFNTGWTPEGYEKQSKTRFVHIINGERIPAGMSGTFFWNEAIKAVNENYPKYRKEYLKMNTHLKLKITVNGNKINSKSKAKLKAN